MKTMAIDNILPTANNRDVKITSKISKRDEGLSHLIYDTAVGTFNFYTL